MTLADVLEKDCPEEFESLEVVYHNSWSDYEEFGAVVVFDFLGELFMNEWGHCVMVENNSCVFDPQPVDADELEELKKTWDELEEAYNPSPSY